MLKPEMIEKLNEQMNLELYSSLLYQQTYLRRCCRVPAPPRPGRDDTYAASV